MRDGALQDSWAISHISPSYDAESPGQNILNTSLHLRRTRFPGVLSKSDVEVQVIAEALAFRSGRAANSDIH